MDDTDDGAYAREPEVDDLRRICQALNETGARYVLIGGFALLAHGGGRTTKDIDLLVDDAPENIASVKKALSVLADNAAQEVADDDVRRYSVVRIADEVVVDLLAKACSVTYADAISDVVRIDLDGVAIPVASKQTLMRTKDTFRPIDAADRQFLAIAIAEEENAQGGKP